LLNIGIGEDLSVTYDLISMLASEYTNIEDIIFSNSSDKGFQFLEMLNLDPNLTVSDIKSELLEISGNYSDYIYFIFDRLNLTDDTYLGDVLTNLFDLFVYKDFVL